MKTTILPRLPAVGKRRLKKLIAFLKVLPPRKFNFRWEVQQRKKRQICGTVCCAVGWTPTVFPRLSEWREHSSGGELFVAAKTNGSGYKSVAGHIFGMGEEIAGDLFFPNTQKSVHRSLPNCESKATPKQVAAMLEKYIQLTETEAQ